MLRTNMSRIMEYLFKDRLYLSFYRFVDYAVQNNTGTQFPRELYERMYKRDILNHQDKQLAEILALDQLIAVGAIYEPTKKSKMISLNQDFFNFLVLMDNTRAKEFSNKEFEELRQSLRLAVDNLKASADDETSDDFRESWVHFNSVANNIMSSLNKNLNKLSSSVDKVADLYNRIYKGETDVNLADLYKKALLLQERHISPCYDFLDADLPMIKMFVELRKFYERRNDNDKAIAVIEFESPIASYRHDLNRIAEKLDNNLINMREEREILLASEKLFNDIIFEMNELRTGRDRGSSLTNECEVYESINYFEGMAQHNSSKTGQLIAEEVDDELEWLDYKAWLQSISEKPLPKRDTSHKKKKTTNADRQKKDTKQLVYISTMAKAVNQEPRVHIADVYKFVYEELSKRLQVVTMEVFLEGLEDFLGSLNHRHRYVKATNERRYLTDGDKRVNYTVITYNKSI